jgi:hypothetical protein
VVFEDHTEFIRRYQCLPSVTRFPFLVCFKIDMQIS